MMKDNEMVGQALVDYGIKVKIIPESIRTVGLLGGWLPSYSLLEIEGD